MPKRVKYRYNYNLKYSVMGVWHTGFKVELNPTGDSESEIASAFWTYMSSMLTGGNFNATGVNLISIKKIEEGGE